MTTSFDVPIKLWEFKSHDDKDGDGGGYAADDDYDDGNSESRNGAVAIK